MTARVWIGPLAALLLAPIAQGLVTRVKSVVAGRSGPPLLQPWRDLAKLLGKGAVYSDTTTVVFRAGPVASLAGVLGALLLLPSLGQRAPVAFAGDLVLLVLLLAAVRFATVLAALDTGSSFEGMGASRETTFSVLVEPALLLCLATLARGTESLSLSEMAGPQAGHAWLVMGASRALLLASLFVLLLAENSRVPVDDPSTHLELTMIHEVMVLDHSGPDLAFFEYAAALKLWLFAVLLVGIAFPAGTGNSLADAAIFLAGIGCVCVAVGLLESTMARLQLPRVPQLLLGATVLSAFGLVLTLR
ncbi:MAG TPA: NADH-quinone oxidoreductase subunit H [Candidatus Polarisedimenticolaceae bacterium]|nr:NADH-quinone oxidoreductase subunit H [Candidatus Polarisedimenticolaceae bacterium]